MKQVYFRFFWISQIRCGFKFDISISIKRKIVSEVCPKCCPCFSVSVSGFSHWIFTYSEKDYDNNIYDFIWSALLVGLNDVEQRQLVNNIFKQSSILSTVPYFVGIALFLTNVIPLICRSFRLMMKMSVDVEMIRHEFSSLGERSDTDSIDRHNTEIITCKNGRKVGNYSRLRKNNSHYKTGFSDLLNHYRGTTTRILPIVQLFNNFSYSKRNITPNSFIGENTLKVWPSYMVTAYSKFLKYSQVERSERKSLLNGTSKFGISANNLVDALSSVDALHLPFILDKESKEFNNYDEAVSSEVDQMCPNFCPCCKRNKQWIRYWLIDCPFFNHIRSKVNDKILFLYNAFNRGNLTNDIVNSNNDNRNSNNSNSNNSNSNNSYSNNSYSNISNSIISNVCNNIENNVYVDSSMCKKVFNFLLGGRSINNSTREWKDLHKCQMKSGAYSDTPFLVVTAAFLQSIIPIAIGQQWSLFNRFKSNRTTTTTKSVNAEETVRQASRASATNEDHNFDSFGFLKLGVVLNLTLSKKYVLNVAHVVVLVYLAFLTGSLPMISFLKFTMIIEPKSLDVSLDSEKDYCNNIYDFILSALLLTISPPGKRSDTDSIDSHNTEIITCNNGRDEKLEAIASNTGFSDLVNHHRGTTTRILPIDQWPSYMVTAYSKFLKYSQVERSERKSLLNGARKFGISANNRRCSSLLMLFTVDDALNR
ncbi:hypothetical protein H8356DRAFT_1418955 [Neocallimastix lanati (nom. inval.)]|nr:hypothetical protein H8356DRAFT_1418955 [Neocallimastix sp. JGI-2020a]